MMDHSQSSFDRAQRSYDRMMPEDEEERLNRQARRHQREEDEADRLMDEERDRRAEKGLNP